MSSLTPQIIIPMSGFGERFRRAGYSIPKALIEIDGRPIISYVIDMFPGERDFIFICNKQHLDDDSYKLEEVLLSYCPSGKIVAIEPHSLGPVHAVNQVEHLIDLHRPVIVNYCDFTCFWDWEHFKKFVNLSQCDGAIPAYKNFHPHLLGSTNYAYMKESDGWVTDIQEKKSFTKNRMDEYASSGTYYFSSGEIMCRAFKNVVKEDLNVAGEYYVSLAFKVLLMEGLGIAVYPIQHFMQWGTPEDVLEYSKWSSVFRHLCQIQDFISCPNGSVVIPMAGFGQRFVNEAYRLPKPLILVSGKPMVVQATNCLPSARYYSFVMRSQMDGAPEITHELKRVFESATIESIAFPTEGQACTAAIGLKGLLYQTQHSNDPITFGACDNGVIFNHRTFAKLLEDPDIDVIVWGVSGEANALRNPEMYGWIDHTHGVINRISVKAPLSSLNTDPIVIGTFTFKRAKDFYAAFNKLLLEKSVVNGEYYIDSCINSAIELGLKCRLFEVDNYISWGTPNDLRTFQYWQSCFHKWSGHEYRLENDFMVSAEALGELNEEYKKIVPALLDKKIK